MTDTLVFDAINIYFRDNPNTHEFPPGKPLWCLPIRYWETEEQKPTSGWSVLNRSIRGTPDPLPLDSSSLYAFKDEYGHCVYLQRSYCFPSWEEAREAQLAIAEIYERLDGETFTDWFKDFMTGMGHDQNE